MCDPTSGLPVTRIGSVNVISHEKTTGEPQERAFGAGRCSTSKRGHTGE